MKKDIEDIFNGLMRNLNQLSNVHFTPKRLTKESQIRTQNVPALQLEEAIPIGVSAGNSKSAKDQFKVDPKAMRDKDELTKEEKARERAHRKRSIKSHLKHKEIRIKESNRSKGLAQVGDRFAVKQVKEKITKKKKEDKLDKELGQITDKNKNAFKSGKFFKNMESITKADKEKKDNKRDAKQRGMAVDKVHTNQSAKKFKM